MDRLPRSPSALSARRQRPLGPLLLPLPLLFLAAGCGDSSPSPSPPSDRAGAPKGTQEETQGALRGSSSPPAAPPLPRRTAGDLVDEAKDRGLLYQNVSGSPQKRDVLEANGAGVAALDLGSPEAPLGDGDFDLVFAQGCASLEAFANGERADLEIFANRGDGTFERQPGPGLAGWWTGLAAGDLDNDGDADLVAGGFGDLRVLLQEAGENGVPRFVPLEGAGVEPEPQGIPAWTTSLALLDADGDGVLDLYVGRYLDLDPTDLPRGSLGEAPLDLPCRWRSYEVFCGPRGLNPQADVYFRGLGDGRFEREKAGLDKLPPAFTLGVCAFDLDADGDSDLYVANDSMPNYLLLNDGDGEFIERAELAGVALSQDGMPEAGMGISAGDVNRDGLLDLAVTNFSGEPTELFLRTQEGFRDETYRLGLQARSRSLLSWGVHLTDFDGDGWLDLFTANGHVYPQADNEYTGTSYGQKDSLWFFGPAGPEANRLRLFDFENANEASLLQASSGSRGSSIVDIDGDGAPDLVVTRIDDKVALGMNHWRENQRIALRFEGDPSLEPGPRDRRTSREALGTRVALVLRDENGNETGLLGELQSSTGYQSASAPEVLFGLGDRERFESIKVFWPSGRITDLPGGAAGRRLTIREGSGLVDEQPLQQETEGSK